MNVREKRANTWTFGLMVFFAVAIGVYALATYGNPDGIREKMFVTDKGSLPDMWYGILWAHAVSAGVALSIGWLQFVKKLRSRRQNVHRIIGYIYAVMIIIGGFTGLYLAYYANGGWFAQAGFASLSIVWLYTLFRSLKSIIIDRNPIEHGRWMVRNYALSCAAITLRLYIPLAAILFGITDTNDSFIFIAWIAWIPNLVMAERLLNRKTDKSRKHSNSLEV